MRKVDTTEAKKTFGTIMESIALDGEKGKLSSDPKTHPIRKVSLPAVEGTAELSTEDLMSLLVERLDMLGYVLLHDPAKVRRNIDEGLAKIKGLQVKKKKL